MRRVATSWAAALPLALFLAAGPAAGQPMELPGVNASPGAGYDMMSWAGFIAAVAPDGATGAPAFEGWATDHDTYISKPPVWPTPARTTPRFQVSLLQRAHLPTGLRDATDVGLPACSAPNPKTTSGAQQIAAFDSGNFPSDGCIAEEVRRNKPGFDYIVANRLYDQAGMVAAYERWVRSGYTQGISFPPAAIELKADWMPIPDLIRWLGNNGVTLKESEVRRNYYVVEVSGAPSPYALVGFHFSSKVLPNWLWTDFEHRLNPGRCDTIGCYDQFGAATASAVPPAAAPNTQYGPCAKSDALLELFRQAGVGEVWQNYCLKGTQIDFVTADGRPTLLGNSVIERLAAGVPISSSSCISCHALAATDSSGQLTPQIALEPVGEVKVQSGYLPYDFVWGIVKFAQP